MKFVFKINKGGSGSGFRGHSGRPGKVGGSDSDGGDNAYDVIRRLTVSGGDVGTISISDDARKLMSGTVVGDYKLFRGIGVVKGRLTKEQIQQLKNMKSGDKAPEFLSKQGNKYASYTKSKQLANKYSEGMVRVVLTVMPNKDNIIVDTTNIHKVAGLANLFDEYDRNYFRESKEVIVMEPIDAYIESVNW